VSGLQSSGSLGISAAVSTAGGATGSLRDQRPWEVTCQTGHPPSLLLLEFLRSCPLDSVDAPHAEALYRRSDDKEEQKPIDRCDGAVDRRRCSRRDETRRPRPAWVPGAERAWYRLSLDPDRNRQIREQTSEEGEHRRTKERSPPVLGRRDSPIEVVAERCEHGGHRATASAYQMVRPSEGVLRGDRRCHQSAAARSRATDAGDAVVPDRISRAVQSHGGLIAPRASTPCIALAIRLCLQARRAARSKPGA